MTGKREAFLRLLLLSAALCALAAGCSSGDDEAADTGPRIVQPGAPGEPSRTLSAEEAAALEPTGSTPADVRFMQGMIHHHAQALRMTALVPENDASQDLELLAKRMSLSQESEIELMQSWLRSRDEPAPEVDHGHGHAHATGPLSGELMPGMATEAELEQLTSARGRDFDRLFLELMIRHHEGALTMVQQLRDAGGGLESEVDAFARHVESDQQIELERMRGLLGSR